MVQPISLSTFTSALAVSRLVVTEYVYQVGQSSVQRVGQYARRRAQTRGRRRVGLPRVSFRSGSWRGVGQTSTDRDAGCSPSAEARI